MAVTEQPQTFSDLYTQLLDRVQYDSSVTSTLNQAKSYINIALHDMHIGSTGRFPWAERQAILLTHPIYEASGSPDGGVTCTQGAAAATFTTSAGTAVLGATDSNTFGQQNVRPGGKLLVSGDSESYEILSIVAGLGDVSVIDSRYVNDDTGTEVAFQYFEDEYALASDFLRPVDFRRFSGGGTEIGLIGRNKFRDLYPNDRTFGKPRVGTIIDRAVGTIDSTTGDPTDTTPRRRIRLHPIPDGAYRIPYAYITSNLATDSTGTAQTQLSADSDEPIVPLRYRMLIVYHALYSWYRDKHDDPTRAQLAQQQYQALLGRARSDTEIGQSRPQLRPMVRPYRARARRPWRSGAGGARRFDQGEFDYGGW